MSAPIFAFALSDKASIVLLYSFKFIAVRTELIGKKLYG